MRFWPLWFWFVPDYACLEFVDFSSKFMSRIYEPIELKRWDRGSRWRSLINSVLFERKFISSDTIPFYPLLNILIKYQKVSVDKLQFFFFIFSQQSLLDISIKNCWIMSKKHVFIVSKFFPSMENLIWFLSLLETLPLLPST